MPNQDTALDPQYPSLPTSIGQKANQIAQTAVFQDYLSRQADNTIRNQLAALTLFSEFLYRLSQSQLTGIDLQTNPLAWQGITWGIVEAFQKWLLNEGYSIATVNNRITAVKTYAQLAAKAGTIPATELLMIRAIKGYGRKQAKRINQRRTEKRVGVKKKEHTPISKQEADALKTNHPNTPQGRRNKLAFAILLDLGLRCEEVINLQVHNFDMDKCHITFYRAKVDLEQTHKMSDDVYQAALPYFQHDAPANGRLFLGNAHKKHQLSKRPLGVRSLFRIVRQAGEQLNLPTLSPHDCRHYWATTAAQHHTDPFALQEAGGWASLAMPRRYIERAKIANEEVRLK